MRFNILATIFLVALLSGIVFSDNGAALQISGHSTVPDTIYPGAAGQLQLTIQNAGTDTAGAVGIDYSTPSQSSSTQIYIGDVGAGTSTVASIPFTVPQNVGSGFFMITLNVVYFGDSSHTVVKNTPATIPVVVSQHENLAVQTLSVNPQIIQPGDKVNAVLEITNTGGVMNGVQISTPDSSSFTLAGASQQTVGNIASGANITVPVTLSSSSSTPTGKYTIPLIVSYHDSLQNTLNQTIDIGPVTVSESSAQFRITLSPITSSEVGSAAQYALNIENLGTSPVSPIVDINQTSQFTPIGSSRIFFDSIAPGENETKTVSVGILATTTAGYYNLPLLVTSNGESYLQDIGISVDATPDVIVTMSSTPQFISSGSSGVKLLTQISNNGNSPIRSVYASVAPQKTFTVVGGSDKFIGTMNVDDFATFQITIDVPPSLPAGEYSVPISIEFKDAENIDHTITKQVGFQVYSGADAMRLNAQSGSAGTSGFSGRNSGGVLFGFGWVQIIGAIVVVVLAYFGYKRWKGSKK